MCRNIWIIIFFFLWTFGWEREEGVLPVAPVESKNLWHLHETFNQGQGAVQGIWVWSLVWEDSTWPRATKPVRDNYWAHAVQPTLCNKRSLCNEKPMHHSWRAAHARHSWRKLTRSKEGPVQPKLSTQINRIKKKNKTRNGEFKKYSNTETWYEEHFWSLASSLLKSWPNIIFSFTPMWLHWYILFRTQCWEIFVSSE